MMFEMIMFTLLVFYVIATIISFIQVSKKNSWLGYCLPKKVLSCCLVLLFGWFPLITFLLGFCLLGLAVLTAIGITFSKRILE